MEALKASSISFSLIPSRPPSPAHKPIFCSPNQISSRSSRSKTKFKLSSTILSSSSSTISTEPTTITPETEDEGGKFDWYSHWYPVAPVCDLDKRVPHGKKIMGLDVVVWWDKNQEKWQVFDDSCPHRKAPLSEGRIDQWGRLQCVYHGWCFDGAGDCKFIPQAPADGPPVHSFKKACAASYPSVEQNKIVWFWPSTDPQFKDIAMEKKPPYIPELDDPSYAHSMGSRDIPYGYEVLAENLMDPSHVPYAHYGLMRTASDKSRPKADREGGRPMELNVQISDINGFLAKQDTGCSTFVAPCVFSYSPNMVSSNGSASSASTTNEAPTSAKQRKMLLIFICIPVSPGNSRLIWTFPRNFGVWIDQVVPRWVFHVGQNLILDSDLYLLHVEERKLLDVGYSNWQKACFVPTKADALVVAFRKWLKRYCGGQIDWGTKFSGTLPPTPPKEQLMDRYWSHVVNCSSCRKAVKGLKVLEVVLQVMSVVSIGIVAALKQGLMSVAARTTAVLAAVFCFGASRWLSHFIYKTFYFHDYNHARV